MDVLTLSIGMLSIAFGSATHLLRIKSPETIGRLGSMRNRFGDRAGLAVHFVAYTLMPLLIGILLLAAGSRGHALF